MLIPSVSQSCFRQRCISQGRGVPENRYSTLNVCLAGGGTTGIAVVVVSRSVSGQALAPCVSAALLPLAVHWCLGCDPKHKVALGALLAAVLSIVSEANGLVIGRPRGALHEFLESSWPLPPLAAPFLPPFLPPLPGLSSPAKGAGGGSTVLLP